MELRTAPLWRTVLVAAILFGASATAFAADAKSTTTETDTETEPFVLPTWTVPEPRPGDAAHYDSGMSWMFGATRELDDAWGERRSFIEFQQSQRPGQDGRPGSWVNATSIEYLDPSTRTVALHVSEGPSNSGKDGCGIGDCSSEQDESYRQVIRYKHDAGWTPCGPFHALQGTVPVQGPVMLWTSCALAQSPYLATGATPNGTVVRYEATETARISEAWFTAHSPYPVRLVIDETIHTLESHRDGTETWDDVQPLPARPMALEPRQVWGPPSPADHDFSLEAAWDVARTKPELAALENPAILEAWHERDAAGSDQEDLWWFMVRDANVAYEVEVLRTHEAPMGTPDPLADEAIMETDYAVELEPANASRLADLTDLPERVPSVDALFARWNGDDPFSWGFSLANDVYMVGRDLHQGPPGNFVCVGSGNQAACLSDLWNDGTPRGRNTTYILVNGEGRAWSSNQDVRLLHPASAPTPGQPVQSFSEPTNATLTTTTVSQVHWDWAAPATVAGTGLLALLLVALHHFAPTVFGFTRVRRDAAREHPTRDRIMQIVESSPGIHRNELIDRLGVATGTARSHIQILEQVGLLSSRKVGGFRCFFPGSVDQPSLRSAAVLRSTTARSLYRLVHERAGMTQLELAQELNRSSQTVHYHLERLAAAGLVDIRRQGRVTRIHLGAGPANATTALK